ncbi:MAG TPA: UDP-N-acetylmuramoyl-tripeptide--D-alanyl-D-alanine ligase [Vicinamibacterales bacterium]|nr:UDP-N-acetylmuramoyl-tripeptide--D-alanyl-D-alanine ligase [Vicinamibacterales bacterium]
MNAQRQEEIVVAVLRRIAAWAHRSTPPRVIAVTGSVGKSTTKDLIASVLETTYVVRRTRKNGNIAGVPAALLGLPKLTCTIRDFRRRLPMIARAAMKPPRPDYFVLEIGTTKSGHIAAALKMFTPSISVITTFVPAHLEALRSLEGVVREKGQLVSALPSTGYAVLRYDDERVRQLAGLHRGRSIFYGFDTHADVWMERPRVSDKGLSTVLHDRDIVPLHFPMLRNTDHLYAVMAAWCVGRIAGVPSEKIRTAVEAFAPLSGRGDVVAGRRGEMIMDDSWNANPASVRSALKAFQTVSGSRRRIAVLGDMLELGADSPRFHHDIGRAAAAYVDALYGIGMHARAYVEGFQQARPGAPAAWYATVGEAIPTIQMTVQAGDAVLVKASHGVHLGRLVEALRELATTEQPTVRKGPQKSLNGRVKLEHDTGGR